MGPWFFQSVNVLPHRSVADVWSILLDDSAWSQWHPEVTNIQWQRRDDDDDTDNNGNNKKKKGGVGASRTVVFGDWLVGPVTLLEEFDVWEDDDDDESSSSPHRKRFSFYIASANNNNRRTFREDFLVEAVTTYGGTGCKFTRTVTFEPSFLVRYGLGWILYPHLRHLFEVKCPERFDRAYNNTTNSNNNDE